MSQKWDKQVPEDFIRWWEPNDTEPDSGASMGGHPDSARVWARKEDWGWKRSTLGITARAAWNTAHYREEFNAWVQVGRPPRVIFRSIAAPIEVQRKFWKDLLRTIQGVGRPMPKPQPFDYDEAPEGGA